MSHKFYSSTILALLFVWLAGCGQIAVPSEEPLSPFVASTEAVFPFEEGNTSVPVNPTLTPSVRSTLSAPIDSTATPQESAIASEFEYILRVVDEETRPIVSAKILVELPNSAPLGTFTDVNGYGGMVVPESYLAQPARIIVEADGFMPYRQEVDLYADRLPQMIRLTPSSTLTVQPPPSASAAVPNLFVLTEDDRSSTWYISGPAAGNFGTGDFLIVYGEIVPGTEIAIAQLRVIAVYPTSLLAQTVLINPDQKIRSGLRVDGELDMLSSSELIPAPDFALGYLLAPGIIRLRPHSDVTPGMVIQAYEAQMIGERISDYLPFAPPLLMRISQIGVSGVVANVVLENANDNWPQSGTLVSDLGIVPTPTATATQLPPTETPSPMPTVAPTVAVLPTATPIPVACQVAVDPELVAYWVREELGCPLGSSSITWASYTPYQSGLMLWRRDTNMVYGFFNSGSWLAVPDVWDGTSATPSRGTPPPGFLEPIRGTGHVWGTDDRFFNGLGWAADEQKGFCAKVQPFEQGFLLLSSTVSSCHEQNLFNQATQGGFGLAFLKAHNAGYWRR